MTVINPSLRKPHPPTLPQVLDTHKRDVMKAINGARPGTIISFNPTKQTASVSIAQKQVAAIAPDGTKTLQLYPDLLDVPVQFQSGGGFTCTFPVAPGDECLLVFCDRELDNWLSSGAGLAPITSRLHDISDAVAIMGIRSNPRALANFSTTAAQLRSDDGNTLVEVGPGKIQLIADEVVVHGRNKTTFDAGGTGFVYTPGLISTYTDGVPTTHSTPTPPEVPT